MADAEKTAIPDEKLPLDIKPKPKIGPRVNKRLMGLGVLSAVFVLLIIGFGLKLRSNAVSGTAGHTVNTTDSSPVIPLDKTEQKTIITNLGPPAASATTQNGNQTGAPTAGTEQGKATAGTVPSPTTPTTTNPNGSPSYRPQSKINDPLFSGDYFSKPSTASAGPDNPANSAGATQPQHVETEAEEARRVERAAIKSSKVIKVVGERTVQAPAGASDQGATAGVIAGSNGPPSTGLGDLAALYKSLIPVSAGIGTQGELGGAASRVTPPKAVPDTTGNDPVSRADKQIANNTLPSMRLTPVWPYQIMKGWKIPAEMEQSLTSNLPGEIRAMVRENIYDTATGKYILIPQGSRLVGTYGESVAYGQKGIPVIWTDIIFPDASSLSIGGMIGEDLKGRAGLRGHVNNHFAQVFSSALVSSVIAAVTALTTNRSGSGGLGYYPNPGQAMSAGAGQSIQETGSQLTRRSLQLQPTIDIPARTQFMVSVNANIVFDGPYASRKALLAK